MYTRLMNPLQTVHTHCLATLQVNSKTSQRLGAHLRKQLPLSCSVSFEGKNNSSPCNESNPVQARPQR